VGHHRTHQHALNPTEATRNWPLAVRRARPEDRQAVLAFATTTWNGWDYMPHAWPVWLTADDGAMLVATVGPTTDGQPAIDANGATLTEGQPVAVSRVALVSATEGWVEGIRVDPRVRGMGVATDLQVAELHWLAANRTAVTRYATSQRNEGSHRLGARHGFELLARFVSWEWKDPSRPETDDAAGEETGFADATRQDLNRRRGLLLDRLAEAGLIVPVSEGDAWWRRMQGDARLAASGRLYERRSWTEQELTEGAFRRHLAAGEVVAHQDDGWGLAIASRAAAPAEDAEIHLGLIVGDNAGLAHLAQHIQQLAGGPIRFRLEAGHIDQELAAGLLVAGFESWPWELHILGRPGPASGPPIDAGRLVLTEKPSAVIRPPD
jgi:GNAT superfamily N-acetyltransferase